MIDINEFNKTGAWKLEDAGDGIAFLVFDLPDEKVDILTSAVLRDLDAILDELKKDDDLKGLIVIGGKEDSGTFIAGADVKEIRSVEDAARAAGKAAQGQSALGKLSSLPAVTLAAIHGNCLGGGTELALACDLRVATNFSKTRIGLPEVQLGILPGFGGSQRLPRLIGLLRAMPIVLTGKPKSAQAAGKIGMVDRVVYPGLLREASVKFIREAIKRGGKEYRSGRPKAPWFQRCLESVPLGRTLIKKMALKNIERRVGSQYPAPTKAIEAMVDGYALSFEAGLQLEARLVGELAASPICKNLIDLFLSSEAARRETPLQRDSDAEKEPTRIGETKGGTRIALLGAGVMGGGIAALFSRKGFRVRMKDIAHESLSAGLKKIHQLFTQRVKRGRMTQTEMENALASVTTTLDYSGFETVDFVLEAVIENMEVKKQVLAEVQAVASENAILASNTSSLSISEMQKDLDRPDRLVGLHFFNPVDRMLLVEIIRGEQTSEEAVETAFALARKLGKIPIRVGDGPGFLVNRLLGPYLNEAVRLFEEGYSSEAIDGTIKTFGMPMGPFELLDEVGLDVAAKVSRVLSDAFGERAMAPTLLDKLTDDLRTLGKKTGRGFYIHRGKRKRINRQMVKLGGAKGGKFKEDDADLWIKRLIYPVINEAARALEEKIVERPSEVDLAMVMGTGFAPFRGGPLRHADILGAKQIAEALDSLREPRLAPCELLRKLASSGEGFYSLEPVAGVKPTEGAVQPAGS